LWVVISGSGTFGDAVFADIAHAIATVGLGVMLGAVRSVRTVIADVTDTVFIGVSLVWVIRLRTIVETIGDVVVVGITDVIDAGLIGGGVRAHRVTGIWFGDVDGNAGVGGGDVGRFGSGVVAGDSALLIDWLALVRFRVEVGAVGAIGGV
jgi:hypothetical protein